jgi:transposase
MKPSKVQLKPWEWRRLRQLRDRAPSPRVGKRAVCLLLSATGDSAQRIAQVTGLSLNTISGIRRRWRQRRLRSLPDRPHPGRPPRVTPEYRKELRRALRRTPLAYGYVHTVWSIARLATYLQRTTGIGVSRDWLRRLVKQEGFVLGRPKHTLRNKRDPQEYQQAKEQLDALNRGPCDPMPRTSCGTWMPPSSSCCPTWHAVGCSVAGNGR